MNAFQFITPQPPDLLSLSIEGARLNLIAISDKFEAEIFQEFTSDITVYMSPSPPQKIEETRNFISESRRTMKIGNNLQFVILSKQGEFLGCCGLHGAGKVKTPELGIWLKKSAHGMGYGREAIHTLVEWSCKNINLDYFIYPVDRRNVPSAKIPQSLGGEVIEESKLQTPNGEILELVVYKICPVDETS